MQVTTVFGKGLCSNSFILTDKDTEKIVIVDLGGAPKVCGKQLGEKLREVIAHKQIKEPSVEVFLTHCHIDHITGEDNVEGIANVCFSAGKQAAKHINAQDAVTLLSYGPTSISYQVEKVYNNHDTISLGEYELEVIYAPGHTDGGAVLYEPQTKALFAGDIVFAGGAPGRVDLPTGNQQQMVQTLERLAELSVETLYSGHGKNTTKNVRQVILQAKKMFSGYW